ncbi:MAG: phosphatidate cytidylyltransferase [Mesorhizobium amorphae]|nr:MAG: phosphatidate cytidylyltransferase [Mesorhizobium amorphae]
MAQPEGAGAPRRTRSNLSLRVMSGTVLGIVALTAVWWGDLPFRIFCVTLGALVYLEWTVVTRAAANATAQNVGWVLLAVVFALLLFDSPYLFPVSLTAVAVMALAALVLERGAWTVGGFIYALCAALPLFFLREMTPPGIVAVLILFAVVWGTDICAFFVGRALGGPKLAPSISPNKTWSGAIGGALAALILGAFVLHFSGITIDPVVLLSLLGLSAASQAGDLFESWVKRRFGMKDSGRIIPGHGGVMDRADGLIAAASASALLVLIPVFLTILSQ